MNSKNFLRASALLYLADGFANRHQSLIRQKRHRIDRVVQFIFAHGARIKARGVHVRAGGIGEDRTEFRQVGA